MNETQVQAVARVQVVLVAALTRNRVIGIDNRLPWHLPEDLKFFKRITLGKPLVMGRRTFDSIGRPLPGRTNIVVTRDTSFAREDVLVCHGLEKALALAEQQARGDGVDEIAVIGGGEIFTQALDAATRLYLTEIAAEIDGDTFFPEIDQSQWQETQRTPVEDKHAGDDLSRPDYAFVTYERRV